MIKNTERKQKKELRPVFWKAASEVLEELDVNGSDMRNFDKILFSHGEDVDAHDFKKYFIAWCFKLQTPTAYRDFVTLQRSIDRLHIAVPPIGRYQHFFCQFLKISN